MQNIVAACLCLALLASPAIADEPHESPLARRVLDGYLLPTYDGLDRSAADTASSVEALCAMPSPTALEASREKFKGLVVAWSRAEVIRLGPITEQGRLDRFLFWPDRKVIGLKQIQALIADPTSAEIDAKSVADKSVGVQGLGALEYVLFGTDADTLEKMDGATRCHVGAVTAANLAIMADDTLKAWRDPKGVSMTFLHPGKDNPTWRSEDETATDIYSMLVQELELLRDVRIDGFLGPKQDGDKPKQAIYWRSGSTIASLNAGLDSLHALFDAADYSGQLKVDDKLLAQSVDAQFANAAETLTAIDGPIADVLSDPLRRARLDLARRITSSLSLVIGTQISGALGLSAGFSSLDGD